MRERCRGSTLSARRRGCAAGRTGELSRPQSSRLAECSAVDQIGLVEEIDALLPQTQCTRCGFEGCRPYAEAIAKGEADINRCPPGGESTLLALAAKLHRPAPAPDTNCGEFDVQKVVWIDPDRCIGCARCLPPCPVDAIVGASRQLHVVLDTQCTGCELCIAPCPVDCISLIDRSKLQVATPAPQPRDNLRRYRAHESRTQARNERRQRQLAERKRRATALSRA